MEYTDRELGAAAALLDPDLRGSLIRVLKAAPERIETPAPEDKDERDLKDALSFILALLEMGALVATDDGTPPTAIRRANTAVAQALPLMVAQAFSLGRSRGRRDIALGKSWVVKENNDTADSNP